MRLRPTALVAAAALALVPALAGASAAPASAADAACEPLSSGQVDPDGTPRAVAAIAPAGNLVTGYCVTSTSGAASYVELAAPVTWVVIRATPGQGIAQYSYGWAPTDTSEVVEPGQFPTTTEPGPAIDPTPAPALEPWSWDWQYAAPTCDALTVAYPANIEDHLPGGALDVNIRFNSNLGRDTFNYHNNDNTHPYRGTTSFVYAQHPRYPASGLRWFTVEWSSVHGTNYEWRGAVNCVVNADGSAQTVDVPQAVTTISGFNASTVKVKKGKKVGADTVVLGETDLAGVYLQRRNGGVWRTIGAVATDDGTARVTFPKEKRPGTYAYRLIAPETEFVSGAVSDVMKVKVVKPKKKKHHQHR